MKHMNKAAKLCIVLAAIICLFSITAYESNTPTKEETLNSSDEYHNSYDDAIGDDYYYDDAYYDDRYGDSWEYDDE